MQKIESHCINFLLKDFPVVKMKIQLTDNYLQDQHDKCARDYTKLRDEPLSNSSKKIFT